MRTVLISIIDYHKMRQGYDDTLVKRFGLNRYEDAYPHVTSKHLYYGYLLISFSVIGGVIFLYLIE